MSTEDLQWKNNTPAAESLGWQYYEEALQPDGIVLCVYGDEEPEEGETIAYSYWSLDREGERQRGLEVETWENEPVVDSGGEQYRSKEAAREAVIEAYRIWQEGQ